MEDKFIFRIEPPQREFLNRIPEGQRGLVTRQCLDIGALLAEEGYLTETGFSMIGIQRRLRKGPRK